MTRQIPSLISNQEDYYHLLLR